MPYDEKSLAGAYLNLRYPNCSSVHKSYGIATGVLGVVVDDPSKCKV